MSSLQVRTDSWLLLFVTVLFLLTHTIKALTRDSTETQDGTSSSISVVFTLPQTVSTPCVKQVDEHGFLVPVDVCSWRKAPECAPERSVSFKGHERRLKEYTSSMVVFATVPRSGNSWYVGCFKSLKFDCYFWNDCCSLTGVVGIIPSYSASNRKYNILFTTSGFDNSSRRTMTVSGPSRCNSESIHGDRTKNE